MKIAIIGAGALGCGFLYPLLREKGHYVVLYDIESRHSCPEVEWVLQNGCTSYLYREPIWSVDHICHSDEAELIITATPPTALIDVARTLQTLSDSPRTVLSCENIYNPAGFLRDRLPKLTQTRFVNGIANVGAFWEPITGNIRCDEGQLEVEDFTDIIGDRVIQMEEYPKAYRRKTLLHNAPHAVIAYLGWKDGAETIPQAMKKRSYSSLFDVLWELFVDDRGYLTTEWVRFSNQDFPDPISRVARDPARKLQCGERLPTLMATLYKTSAAPLVAEAIQAAIDFGVLYDPLITHWVYSQGREMFLTHYCGLDPRMFYLLESCR